MSNNPLISVIIPVYNAEQYLKECLDSVINQTLKDVEIISINDGSTDNSLSILQDYARKDDRIKILDKKNEGVGKARNDGILNSCGEFVIFMDPDDFYPTADILETLYSAAKKHDVLICGGEFSHYRDGVLYQDFSASFLGYLFDHDALIEYKDYQFDYGYHRFIYNRKFLVNNNIFYPNYKRYQDPPFFVNAMIQAKKFYALHKITYGYRIGHNNVKWTKEKVYDNLCGLYDVLEYAARNKLEKLEELTLWRCFYEYFPKFKRKYTFSCYKKLLYIYLRQVFKYYSFSAYKTFDDETSYKLFGFIPLYSVKTRKRKTIHKIFLIPFGKSIKKADGNTRKYYFCGVPVMKITEKYK